MTSATPADEPDEPDDKTLPMDAVTDHADAAHGQEMLPGLGEWAAGQPRRRSRPYAPASRWCTVRRCWLVRFAVVAAHRWKVMGGRTAPSAA